MVGGLKHHLVWNRAPHRAKMVVVTTPVLLLFLLFLLFFEDLRSGVTSVMADACCYKAESIGPLQGNCLIDPVVVLTWLAGIGLADIAPDTGPA